MLLAETNHRTWIDRILAGIRNPGSSPEELAPLSANACHFGNWYNSDASRRFAHIEAFGQIAPVHRRIHEQAVCLLQARASGNLIEAQCCENVLETESIRLIELLSTLRAALVAELKDMPGTAVKH
jgi:hypothetical protein